MKVIPASARKKYESAREKFKSIDLKTEVKTTVRRTKRGVRNMVVENVQAVKLAVRPPRGVKTVKAVRDVEDGQLQQYAASWFGSVTAGAFAAAE